VLRQTGRYAEYAQAISCLASNIAKNALASLTERLKATKAEIVQQLGPP
jgi:hypothetical protein